MNTGQSQVKQIFALIEELVYLNKQPRRAPVPGVLTLESLSDEVRAKVSGVIMEAKMVLDKNMGPVNEFSNALAMLRAHPRPMPYEVQEVLQRAVKYMDASEPKLPLHPAMADAIASLRPLVIGKAEIGRASCRERVL